MNSPTSSTARQYHLPKNAFDAHVHVFNPKLGPYGAGRAYTPEDAPLAKLLEFNRELSGNSVNTNLVLVQPSPYENDCTVMLHCLRELRDRGMGAFGIAVLDLDNTTDAQLQEMHTLGVRGIRLNFQADRKEVYTTGLTVALQRTAERIRHLPGWMIQLFVPGWTWDYIHDAIVNLSVRIIADHLGGMLGASKLSPSYSAPTSQPGFSSLLALAKCGHVWVKISGLYRMSNEPLATFIDLRPVIHAFAKEISDQLIWGSDWPHTGDGHNRMGKSLELKEPFRRIDDHAVLRNLYEWMGSVVYAKMLVDNPARLFWEKGGEEQVRKV